MHAACRDDHSWDHVEPARCALGGQTVQQIDSKHAISIPMKQACKSTQDCSVVVWSTVKIHSRHTVAVEHGKVFKTRSTT